MKKEKIYNYFYIVNNLKNGRFYLGVHSTNKLADGYMGSGDAIKAAIKNYGKENFEITPLKFFGTRKELLAFEKEIVNERFLEHYKGICYNLKKGGEGGKEKMYSDEELKVHAIKSVRKWQQNNPQKIKEINLEWAKNNPEKKKESDHKYYQSNKEKVKEYHQKREQTPKGKEARRKYNRKYRLKKKAEKLAAQQDVII